MLKQFGSTLFVKVWAIALLLCALPLFAQTGSHPTSPGYSRPDGMQGPEDEDPLREHPELRDRLQRSRALERQRRIVDDANRLVELTVQYRKALDAHGTATADDQKLLSQIEKLAREVKDRMRGM